MQLRDEIKNLLRQGKVMAIHQIAKSRGLQPLQIEKLLAQAAKEIKAER